MVELIERFGTTTHRTNLISNLHKVLAIVRKDFSRPIYIDGGFVTRIVKPSDIDMVVDMIEAHQEERWRAFTFMLQNWGKWHSRWKIHFMVQLPANSEKFTDTFQRVGPNSAIRLGLTPDHPKGILLLRP